MIGVSDANSVFPLPPKPRQFVAVSGCIASQPANVVALRPERR